MAALFSMIHFVVSRTCSLRVYVIQSWMLLPPPSSGLLIVVSQSRQAEEESR
jgi:hypothetical protein